MALSFPLELQDNPDYYRAMVEIKAFKTLPAEITKVASVESLKAAESGANDFGSSAANVSLSVGEAILGAFTNDTVKKLAVGKGGEAMAPYKDKRVTGKEKLIPDDQIQTIQLYMPESFVQTDTFSYGMAELGQTGAAALGVARSGGGVFEAGAAAVAQATAGISDTVGALVGNGGLGRLALARLGSKLGNQGGIGAAAELAAQATMNPNIRATFKSVGPRRFSFLFNMIPKSSAEAANIEWIIRDLRRAAYPNELPPGDNGQPATVPLLFEYPDLFRVTQKVKTEAGYEVLVGTPILYCYLESIGVNYNPTANTFHADGYPTQTNLTLNFIEYRTLSRASVVRGFGPVPGDPEDVNFEDEFDTPPTDGAPRNVGSNFTSLNATEDDVRSPF